MDRGEWVGLVVLVAVAFALRIAHFDRMAVEHFDEGVYVSNLWFDADADFRYPFRHLYAPPLVPGILEWSMILFGPGTWGTMLPGILFGTATVPLAWWAGREWFGRWAGWTAGVLVAFADQHVLFSRTALVDVPLVFWMLLAAWLLWRAFTRNSWRWAAMAGVATGLAWSTKYNGWLPLAIGLAGGLPWAFFDGNAKRAGIVRTLALWGLVAAVAFLSWLPVLRDLQPRGGYAAVAAVHATYVDGLAGWWPNLRQQMQNTWWTGRSLHGVGWILLTALLLYGVSTTGPVGARTRMVAAVILLGGGAVLFVAGPGVVVLLVGGGIVTWWLVDEVRAREPRRPSGESAARWLLAAWFVGLLVATPFYRPYPRLLLPWLTAGWMIIAGGAESLVRRLSSREASTPADVVPTRARDRRLLEALALVLLAALLLGWAYSGPTIPAWDDRTSWKRFAAEEAERAEESGHPGTLVLVFAEPAAFHHLRRAGIEAAPVAEVDRVLALSRQIASATVVLLAAENAHRTTAFQEAEDRLRERSTAVTEYEFVPSRLVSLNLFTPDELARHSGRPTIVARRYSFEE